MLAGQSLVCGWLLEFDGQRCQPLAQLHNVSAQLAESRALPQTSQPNFRFSSKCVPVVVSGHISDDPLGQIEELTTAAKTGGDGIVLVTNRLDPKATGTETCVIFFPVPQTNPFLPLLAIESRAIYRGQPAVQ